MRINHQISSVKVIGFRRERETDLHDGTPFLRVEEFYSFCDSEDLFIGGIDEVEGDHLRVNEEGQFGK